MAYYGTITFRTQTRRPSKNLRLYHDDDFVLLNNRSGLVGPALLRLQFVRTSR